MTLGFIQHLVVARIVRILAVHSLVILGVIGSQSRANAGEVREDFMSATFRIFDGANSGTCFLIAEKTPNPESPRRVILATAAHVLKDMRGQECQLTLRTEAEDHSYSRRQVPLVIRDGDFPNWTRHPDMDIATMLIDLPEGVAAKPLEFDQIADEARVVDRTICVGCETWVASFPATLESNSAGWPVLRKGSIASHPLSPIKTYKTILIDMRAANGDSGGPVMVIVQDRPMVIGVVSGMHRQTDRTTTPFEDRTTHVPLGVSIISQAVFLRETIELMYAK